MTEIKAAFLFTMALEVEVSNLGDTPYGSRRVGRFGVGSFEGPKLKGTPEGREPYVRGVSSVVGRCFASRTRFRRVVNTAGMLATDKGLRP